VPNEIVIEAMIKGLRPGPTAQYFARKPPETLEKLLQKMDEYIRADNDFRQRREEAYRFSEMTRGFGGRIHPRHVRSIHSTQNDDRGSQQQRPQYSSQASGQQQSYLWPPALFTKTCDGDLFVCQIYVDDIIFGSTNQKSYEEFSRVMTQKFEMSMMGEVNYFLGFQVKQLKDGTFISQTKYTQDLLKQFGMKDAKPAKTPMGTDGHVDLNKGGKSVDQKAYRSVIGLLFYLGASRPDIMLSVCICARYQSDPRKCYLVAVKRILRYLVSTPCFGIWYPKGSTFDLIGYSDSNYAGCKVDRKSTSGTC
jgi:hypothetical protein